MRLCGWVGYNCMGEEGTVCATALIAAVKYVFEGREGREVCVWG